MAKLLPIATGDSSGRKKDTYRIGDLAKRINKSTRALRLYEEMNLLGSVTRNEGGQRIYEEEVFARLTWIEKLQSLGFSLLQIQSLSRIRPKRIRPCRYAGDSTDLSREARRNSATDSTT